jgi:hypothetical protein
VPVWLRRSPSEAYAKGKKERPPFAPPLPPAAGAGGEEKKEEEEAVPTELLCLICREMLHDAVLIPCCGNSYCDDCEYLATGHAPHIHRYRHVQKNKHAHAQMHTHAHSHACIQKSAHTQHTHTSYV